ncbi:helix-turn-helix transcriptional regulator [Shimazuella alba]|uniref:helix-turn-helix transcriptional regulator n=1 Tax=Shimazuella alba TaxID=2690964 RepID=UPI001F1C4C60|nr:helix-turn-helix transcriptional regulator [Shimazuella alba]
MQNKQILRLFTFKEFFDPDRYNISEYLRRRRLTLAAEALSKSNCKIIEIAFKYGYETPEAFTKAFRKQHGITPSKHEITLESSTPIIV